MVTNIPDTNTKQIHFVIMAILCHLLVYNQNEAIHIHMLLYLEQVTTEMQGKFRTIIIFSNRKQYMYQNVFYCQFSSKSIHYVTSKLFREFIKQNLQYD